MLIPSFKALANVKHQKVQYGPFVALGPVGHGPNVSWSIFTISILNVVHLSHGSFFTWSICLVVHLSGSRHMGSKYEAKDRV